MQDPWILETIQGYKNSFPGAASHKTNPSLRVFTNGERSTHRRGSKVIGKAGHKPSKGAGRLYKQCIPRSKEGQVEVDTQPKGVEYVHDTRTLQDGRYSLGEGPLEQRRLYVQAGPEGCIPVSSNQSSL